MTIGTAIIHTWVGGELMILKWPVVGVSGVLRVPSWGEAREITGTSPAGGTIMVCTRAGPERALGSCNGENLVC